jgi:hypothetical protein
LKTYLSQVECCLLASLFSNFLWFLENGVHQSGCGQRFLSFLLHIYVRYVDLVLASSLCRWIALFFCVFGLAAYDAWYDTMSKLSVISSLDMSEVNDWCNCLKWAPLLFCHTVFCGVLYSENWILHRAGKVFPEMWYSTVMVGYMTTLT